MIITEFRMMALCHYPEFILKVQFKQQNLNIMKKILLAVTALFLVSAIFAQSGRVDVRQQALSTVAKKVQLTGFEQGAIPQTLAPITRATSRNYIGMTYYDCQSNGSMASRIIAHNDGTVSAIWTTNGSTASSRGTGYNYYDASSWINPSTSTSRIESVRTGWPAIASVGDAEIVVAHNGSSALVVNTRAHKGTGDWTQTTLQGPSVSGPSGTSTALLWPSIASSGNTLHLIACTESDDGFLYRGINCCLVYYRGTYDASSNAITWEEPRVVGEVTSAEVNKFQGDGYAIAAKNNTVAIVAAPGMTKDAFLWKSTDNGVNFTKTVFFETPHAGDTAYRSDGCLAVAVGDDGLAHVAMGTYMCYIETDTSSTYTWWPSVGYLLYWNENMRPITYNGSQNSTDPEIMVANDHTIFERFNLDCDTSLWGLSSWGVDAYPSYGVGAVSFPQLVSEGGNVYLVFCQLMEYPFIDNANSMYFRGVFATKSTNNGQSFGANSWLSYNKDCYYLSDWSLFPMDSTTSYEQVAQVIYTEGESVYPAVAPNLVNGKLAMIWQQDYNAGSEVKESSVSVTQNESSTYFFSIDANQIGVFNNTNEVCQGLWIDSVGINNRDISGMKMYPNPAKDLVNITFSAKNAESGVVSVMNLMGQIVYTANLEVNEGNNMITVPVKQLTSGVYMVTLQTNTGISTQKLIVNVK